MNAMISIFCPPMKIFSINSCQRRTDSEPMLATIVFPNAGTLVINPVIIPETVVNKVNLIHWVVDACVGSTPNGVSPSLTVELPVEDTVLQWWTWYPTMVAKSITAKATLTLSNGEIWQGSVVFPDCPVNILVNPMVAAAITATGELSKI